uniref:C-type lectin domain-containing protein n=1 Tax=Poecilia latipinna TaxID=48699 RepID=A0A3B3TUB9_9TELE
NVSFISVEEGNIINMHCCFMDCQLYEFLYINENKTWTEAQQYCREKHTDLVTVTNMKDMKRLINISAGRQSEAWIGLYDQTHGTRTCETNWNPSTSEPSDSGGVENCGFMWKTLKGQHRWFNKNATEEFNFICKI